MPDSSRFHGSPWQIAHGKARNNFQKNSFGSVSNSRGKKPRKTAVRSNRHRA
jgi:hypothetical protein